MATPVAIDSVTSVRSSAVTTPIEGWTPIRTGSRSKAPPAIRYVAPPDRRERDDVSFRLVRDRMRVANLRRPGRTPCGLFPTRRKSRATRRFDAAKGTSRRSGDQDPPRARSMNGREKDRSPSFGAIDRRRQEPKTVQPAATRSCVPVGRRTTPDQRKRSGRRLRANRRPRARSGITQHRRGATAWSRRRGHRRDPAS